MPGVAAVLLAGDLGLSPQPPSDEVEGPFGRPVLAAEADVVVRPRVRGDRQRTRGHRAGLRPC